MRGRAGEVRGKLGGMDESNRSLVRTSLSARPDVTSTAQLRAGRVEDVTTEPRDRAQIRLTIRSDDLLALVTAT